MTLNVPNLDKLIAHLEAQPPEMINMGHVNVAYRRGCGTCGCIVGHGKLIFEDCFFEADLHEILGIEWAVLCKLTQPSGWKLEGNGVKRYPAHRVIATLKRLRDHYLATGEIVVDWGEEPTAGEPRAAPQVIELTLPALPAEITRLLEAAKVDV